MPESPPREQPLLLVADDTEANRYAVVRHLKAHGYAVEEADNGGGALARTRELLPDLLILDVRMPDMNGFEVARQVKADPRTAGVPILHISASFTDSESMARGLDNGADGYLTHPIEPVVMIATVRSLLRARTAERAVRVAAGQWQATFDAIGEGVCLVDHEGRIQRCNRAFEELMETGAGQDGQPLWEMVPGLAPLAHAVGVEGIEQPRAVRLEINGRTLRISTAPIRVESAGGDGAVLVVTDLTRERLVDERARRALQMETTGRLAGGVAHEINNMMTAILSYAEFALRGVALDDPRRADIEGIHKAASRSAEVARQLLTFSRRQVINPQTVDLHTLLREAQPTIARLLGADKVVVLDLAAERPWVAVDPLGLEQVLLNLALNARDAMPGEGRFEITTRNVVLDEAARARHGDVMIRTGPYVELTLGDTGLGMDPDTLQHVFEPFFTTKGVGEGTGLGLATVYGMVKQSDGYIWVESQVGRGTRFIVQLPEVAEVTATPARTSHPEAGRASGTVLVVEDEPIVLTLLSRSLREAGYQVIEAQDGRMALEQMETRGGEVSVVVTDIVMPRMNGRELAEQVRARWPDIPILFISGYTSDEVVKRGLIGRGETFLQKPFAPRGIVEKVQELLAQVG